MPPVNPNEPNFGPDNNLAIDREQTVKVTVPAKWKADFKFSSEAAFENAIVIYDGKTFRRLHEAGNHGRSLAPWTFDDTGEHARHLVITGWHKKSAPNPGVPWNQSPIGTGPREGQSLDGGFEDWIDMDFNDVAFSVKVHK
jgi:hypothetical protein